MFYSKKKISLISIVYLLVIIGLSIYLLDASKPITLSTLGDFLAGVFSPLAFLFLVLGYIQQGRELKQNTQALQQQVRELNENVKIQKDLLKIQEDELRSKHFSVLPNLILTPNGCTPHVSQNFEYDNNGEVVDVSDELEYSISFSFNLICEINSAHGVKITNNVDNFINEDFFIISKNTPQKVLITFYDDELKTIIDDDEETLNLIVNISYFNILGKEFNRKFQLYTTHSFDWSLGIMPFEIREIDSN